MSRLLRGHLIRPRFNNRPFAIHLSSRTRVLGGRDCGGKGRAGKKTVCAVVNLLKHTELIYSHLLEEVRRGQLPIDAQPLEARIGQSQQHRRTLQSLVDEIDRPSLGRPELNAESFGHE